MNAVPNLHVGCDKTNLAIVAVQFNHDVPHTLLLLGSVMK